MRASRTASSKPPLDLGLPSAQLFKPEDTLTPTEDNNMR
jgi:hypothetical protein